MKQGPTLWERIEAFEIDDPNASYKFSDRLAHENLWKKEYTLRVIDEYKIFMYLGCILPFPVTPSIAIDQCWHLHMIYTQNYKEFCRTIKKEFHHGPTKGGSNENEKYSFQYKITFDARCEIFGFPETLDIWVDPNQRWLPCDLRYVDFTKHWVIPTRDIKAIFKILIKEIKIKLKYIC